MHRTVAILLLLFAPLCWAADREISIPEPMEPWLDWVRESSPQLDCPSSYADYGVKYCRWAGTLHLDLSERGGYFTQTFRAFADTWLPLPGESVSWPGNILLNGEPGVVLQHDGHPALRVAAGQYEISGAFQWQQLPNSLALPADTGIVALRLNGATVTPNRDRQGKLWIRSQATDQSADQARNRLDLQVQRRFTDLVPMRMEVRLVLDVSGKQRELLLPSPLLEKFIPIDLQSPLPARLESDTGLRMQLRPGHWEVTLLAYRPGEVLSLQSPPAKAGWPGEEIWSFGARNYLRLVEPAGLQPIDPRQTTLPAGWHKLPSFVAKAGDALEFTVIRRGDPDPEPDRLSLQRMLWLDFDGGGYTVQDHLNGTITRTWRLESTPELALGRVAIDGNNQSITRKADSDSLGIEVRRGSLNLLAESRYEGPIHSLPLGWQHDMNRASATLQLPPGWEVFSVSGVDNNPHSWVQRWTLLDIFLVLIVVIAVSRLWGYAWAGLALLTLALTWHVHDAPHMVWLYLIAALALLRVVPEGRLQWLVTWFRNVSFISLVVIAIPFMIHQARIGIYPQLERYANYQSAQELASVTAPATIRKHQARRPEADARDGKLMPEAQSLKAYSRPGRTSGSLMNQTLDIQSIDPNANIQTGPGLPNWQWRSLPLNWNGPVAKTQTIELTLVSPALNRVIHFLRILLVLALAFGLLNDKTTGGLRGWLASLKSRWPAARVSATQEQTRA